MNAQPQWRKSSRSGQHDCIEVADNVPGTQLIRDSKLGDASPILNVSPQAYQKFIEAVKVNY